MLRREGRPMTLLAFFSHSKEQSTRIYTEQAQNLTTILTRSTFQNPFLFSLFLLLVLLGFLLLIFFGGFWSSLRMSIVLLLRSVFFMSGIIFINLSRIVCSVNGVIYFDIRSSLAVNFSKITLPYRRLF